ncbi:twin transmembrane helix small protein [Paracoccus aminophilus]|uniref:HIG1 domain-containing protein n=1 Tax=Paracoccus aminophilus JCM 7686 TaxID=1367847 RepID=S5XJW1_PARAH|nr:twin transmembrane helix small protein [Paracoccus aminophilus]AGT07474.1 hypothetical protein JCM7686_0365 [Paracoccus aminophilus JCM 7686]
MHKDPLFYLAAFSCLVVLAVLMTGVGGFAKGGEFNRRNGNRLMRWRLIAQAIAIVIMMTYLWSRGL